MEIINGNHLYYRWYYVCDWGFIWDRFGRGWGGEEVSGGKAAPDGVATQIILVYEGGGGGRCIWPYLLRMVMDKYGFVLDVIYWEKRRSTT